MSLSSLGEAQPGNGLKITAQGGRRPCLHPPLEASALGPWRLGLQLGGIHLPGLTFSLKGDPITHWGVCDLKLLYLPNSASRVPDQHTLQLAGLLVG